MCGVLFLTIHMYKQGCICKFSVLRRQQNATIHRGSNIEGLHWF